MSLTGPFLPAGQAAIPDLSGFDYVYRGPTPGLTMGDLSGRAPRSISAFNPFPFTRSKETLVAEGASLFEVLWSATVTAKRTLVRPSVDGIRHVETKWDAA